LLTKVYQYPLFSSNNIEFLVYKLWHFILG
jgi:hypothetical protein